ncbi:MAG: undecaprenyl-phosphate glucose phosphotransferase [Lachnospiraceae bacterium]|nr:undecaprenyl-phosphate glucose phosphotransferase [Lachnospiraceae bacterium]
MIKAHQKSFHRLFIISDTLLVIAAFFLSYFIRFSLIGTDEGVKYLPLSEYVDYLFFIALGYLLIFLFGGLYNPQRSRSLIKQFFEVIRANIFGAVYFLALLYLVKQIDISRGYIAVFAVTNTALDLIFRLVLFSVLHSLRKHGKNLKHVLMVGYSRTAEVYIDRVKANPEWGYAILGILDDEMEKGTRYRGVSVMGKLSDLDRILSENDLDEMVIALKVSDYTKLDTIVGAGEKYGLHTRFAPDFMNVISGNANMEDMDGVPVINIRSVPLSSAGNRAVKRIEDLILGTVALILAAIPMIMVAAGVKLTSKGPVIFKQTRVGRHNKEFTMYKFRSMVVQDAEEEKKEWTTADDARVTGFGKFIRKTSLDELPQLFNVLKGEMSLVGPRPERPYYVDKFKEEIPKYMVKHQVRPGITGWAQVNGYRGDTNIARRIECDIWYIENWSLWLDISILLKTVFKASDNAY